MYEFDEFDEPEDSEADGLRDLIEAYEHSLGEGAAAWFDSEDLEQIATFYFEAGRVEEALAVVSRQLDDAPFQSDGWLRRGVLLNHLDRHEEALEALVDAILFTSDRAEPGLRERVKTLILLLVGCDRGNGSGADPVP